MLLVGNGTVITRDPVDPLQVDGCICIEDEVILEIGDTTTLRAKYPHAKWIDAQEGLIMPGLINTHNHIYSAFARGLSLDGPAPLNFLQVLEHMWWRIDRQLTLEDTTYSAYWTLLDGIKNGVTTVFDHHASYGGIEGSLFAIADVAEQLGLRTCLCYEVSDRDGNDKMRAAVKENVDFMNAYKHHPHHRGMMGLHAAFTLCDDTLNYCAAQLPTDHGYHIHVAEGINDLHDSLRDHGKRIINRLHDFGILGKQTIAGHCIHINPEEMALLQATDTIVVHNPE
ncbi:MAG: amidohydrolase family protein, partial [Cellulosilyticaceae bacterium]